MDDFKAKIKQFRPYLEDLFNRLRFIALCFIISFIAGFFLSTPLIKYLILFFDFKNVTLATTSPFQLFDLAMDIGFFFSAFICIPITVHQTYVFIRNGLKKKERRTFFFTLPLSILLFVIGFVYGFFILYFTLQVLANVNIGLGIQNLWDISFFMSKIIYTSALLGLIFQFPIILSVLIRFGLLKIESLKNKRRYATMAIVIFTSLLPPTDGVSLLMMALPLVAIYEITIIYNRVFR